MCSWRSYLRRIKRELKIVAEFIAEDEHLIVLLKKGYHIDFKLDLSFIFKLIPEVDIKHLANLIEMKPELLNQYASGSVKTPEVQALKVMNGLNILSEKLKSIQLTV